MIVMSPSAGAPLLCSTSAHRPWAIRKFVADRDCDQFHSPKNLAAALMVEAAELLEHFSWLTEEQSRNLSAETQAKMADELADILIYLVRTADKLDVDLLAEARDKLARNAQRYPVEELG